MTAAYGFQTAPVNAGSGTADVAAGSTLSALTPGTGYHYRLVAVTASATSLGADQTLTTISPPAVTTGAPANIGPTGGTINGTVNPNGQATTYYFQFGSTVAYGLQTEPATAGAGTAVVAVKALLTALQSDNTYHYRLVATSAGGTVFGSDQTLKTTAPAPSKSRLGLFGHTAFVSPEAVGGIFVGCVGQSKCSGSMTISRNGVTLGQRPVFFVNANDGGIVHFTFSAQGARLLRQRHRLPVQVVVAENGGNRETKTVTLVPFS
jgi:hypothetical protein